MIDALALCLSLATGDLAPRAWTCALVATTAAAYGQDPAETVAQAWVESRWSRTAVSGDGCVGPLQVQPKYRAHFCSAAGEEPGCGDLVAGIGARLRWQRWGRRTGQDWMCGYSAGTGARGPCAYRAAVEAVGGW